jgi:hypothetical protein
MANPNRTVARSRKPPTWNCVEEKPFKSDRVAAFAYCEEQRQAGKHARVIPFKTGPRRAPVRQYNVRVYERVKSTNQLEAAMSIEIPQPQDSVLYTIQFGLGPDVPLEEGGSGADEPIWYFDKYNEFSDSVTLLQQHQIDFVPGTVPSDQRDIVSAGGDDRISDYDDFKEYVGLELMARARRDEPEH